MSEDFERCYRAVLSKDARFDGWFVTAVLTTRIYCRPSCPARPPHRHNLRFLPTAAAAQQAGFRACKRCRPDATPGSPEWNVRADVVARAMRLIADGVVDREGVTGLASRLGYSTRQIERHLRAEVGAGPLAVARAQRAQTARVLIERSRLPFARVAFAAGFSSIRQFNDTVRQVFALSPTSLRSRVRDEGPTPSPSAIILRLPFRKPFVPDNVFGHLAATAVPGCEEHRDGSYRRTLRLPAGNGVVSLKPTPDHVACTLAVDDLRDLTAAISRCRRLLDLDADPEAVTEVLRRDEGLASQVDKAPGRRVPRTVDEAEMAVRAVMGQQVSTAAARVHAARLVAACGTEIADPAGGLTHTFPSADQIAEHGHALRGLPRARARCVADLARGMAEGRIDLGSGSDWQRARRQLGSVPGIGEWTTETIAMRALGDPDAFPASDMGVRSALAQLGARGTRSDLLRSAEAWRPWRAYAVQYLWATLEHPINRWPPRVPAPTERTGRHGDRRLGTIAVGAARAGAREARERAEVKLMSLVHYRKVRSPVGVLTIAGEGGTVTHLTMEQQAHEPSGQQDWVFDDSAFDDVADQLGAYFAGELTEFDVRLRLDGTPFQKRVWSALAEIPYGTTVSYGEIARLVGSPRASRAVGLANGRNPVAIVVPCHRVIGSSGTLVGYGGGLDRKRRLLELERSVVATSGGRLSVAGA